MKGLVKHRLHVLVSQSYSLNFDITITTFVTFKSSETIHDQTLLNTITAKLLSFPECENSIESVEASIATNTLANTLSSDSPELEVRPASVSGDLGEEVVLQCLASSNPPPAYKWFRNDDLDTVSKHGAFSRY